MASRSIQRALSLRLQPTMGIAAQQLPWTTWSASSCARKNVSCRQHAWRELVMLVSSSAEWETKLGATIPALVDRVRSIRSAAEPKTRAKTKVTKVEGHGELLRDLYFLPSWPSCSPFRVSAQVISRALLPVFVLHSLNI